MDIFISWSGSRSRLVAEILRTWLPGVLQAVDPWLSSADIDAGSRWHQELGSRLSSCNFGIICLTPENQTSAWLLYEAGALSKAVENSKVVPYLVGLRKADVSGPLSHFQAAESDIDGTFELVRSLNATIGSRGERVVLDEVLKRTYELWWPQLSSSLQNAREAVDEPTKNVGLRKTEEMVLELVENSRAISRRFEALLERLEPKAEPKAEPKVIHTKSISVEPEVIEAVRDLLTAELSGLEGELPANVEMERAVERWNHIRGDKTASFETLNEALRGAKSLWAYLNR